MNQAAVVSIDESGTLVATSKLGSAILQVTAVEEFGVTQDLSVIVKVSDIFTFVKPHPLFFHN